MISIEGGDELFRVDVAGLWRVELLVEAILDLLTPCSHY
jgi:hypothetical protein